MEDERVGYSVGDDDEEVLVTREEDRQILLEYARRHKWGDAGVLREIAMACFQAGYFPEAEAVCRRILELDPDDKGALLHVGVALLHDGRPAEAEAVVQEYLRCCPECSVGQVNLAKIYAETGRQSEADAALERALELDPDNAHALDLFYLGLRDTGQTAAALRRLERLAQTHPCAWGPYRAIAQHWQREGDPEQALAYCRRAYERAPRSGELLRALSGYLGQQGHLEELVSVVEGAARLGPIPPEATYNLARAYLELGRIGEARSLCDALRAGATPAWQPVLAALDEAIEEACLQPA